MSVKEINEKNFEQEVLKSDTPVVIDFWAEWCGPCRMFSPIFDELSEDYKDVKFMKLNVDNNEEIARRYNIMSIPTTMIFKDGKIKGMMIGAVPKNNIKKFIDENK
ncbi:MAG: thioredoxin [Candidatus Marsarchaeota archaeon]|nr:thioredoxin [Candidatus Marsarchaeota archaeon]